MQIPRRQLHDATMRDAVYARIRAIGDQRGGVDAGARDSAAARQGSNAACKNARLGIHQR